MTRAGFNGYYVLLTGDKKTPEDGADKKKSFWFKITKKYSLQWSETFTIRHGLF